MKETLEILEKVNQFYSQSFEQLILITIVILTFVGVVLPILIMLYQKRLFKLEQQEIEISIKNNLSIELKTIEDKIRNEYKEKELEFESKILRIEEEIKIQSSKSLGGILHVQGNGYYLSQKYIRALESFIEASGNHLTAKNESGLKRLLAQINTCFDNINKKQLEEEENITKS